MYFNDEKIKRDKKIKTVKSFHWFHLDLLKGVRSYKIFLHYRFMSGRKINKFLVIYYNFEK
jgi:hypothetical protein